MLCASWERKVWKSWGVVLCLQLACNDGKGGWEERDADKLGGCGEVSASAASAASAATH